MLLALQMIWPYSGVVLVLFFFFLGFVFWFVFGFLSH